MHKAFYASGFLYHSPSQQILLQQRILTDTPSSWSLFGGTNLKSETVEGAFKRIIYSILNLKLAPPHIHPVYTYFHETLGKDHAIAYAEIGSLKKFPTLKNAAFSWFTRKQIHKLHLDEQTKQDIIVSLRVVDAQMRKSLGMHTLE